MDVDSPRRRSGRAAKPNKKYTIDPFEQYRELLEHESSHSPLPVPLEQDSGSDDDFDAVKDAQELADAAGNEDEGGRSDSEDEDEAEAEFTPRLAIEDASDEDEDIAITTTSTPSKPKALPKKGGRWPNSSSTPGSTSTPRKKPPQTAKNRTNFSHATLPIFDPLGNTGAKGRNIHLTRGVPEPTNAQSREQRILYSIGTGGEDGVAYVRARERWLDDATVPSRREVKGKGENRGGLAWSPWYTGAKRRREVEEEMGWYYEEGGREAFGEGQVVEEVDGCFAEDNYTREGDGIVSGPIDGQSLFDGPVFGEAWDMGEAYAQSAKGDHHRAWVFNAGARIQALEWSPNKNEDVQYIAVATSLNPSEVVPNEDVQAPAFTPYAKRQQCLQIWEISAQGSETGSRIEFGRKPRLRAIYSTDWGYIKKMRWCPVPDRAEGSSSRLGFLAAVFSDGYLRVLDLPVPVPSQQDPSQIQYLHISSAAFASKPPETLATCLTWLSSKSLAIGTASGSVALYSLSSTLLDHSRTTYPNPQNASPWFHQRLHQGYIQSLVSGYPSRPHYLITHSFDGLLRITDLRSPHLDTATSQRSRIAQGPVTWHDISQSALNVDDNFTMKSYAARVFYKATSVARFSAFAGDVSTSCLHASVLVGCVDGSVWVTNPMRRLRDHKWRPLAQRVLGHEWRRPVPITTSTSISQQDEDGDVEMETQQEAGSDGVLKRPLVRLLTGYKIQSSDMGQESRANATKDFVSFATVYEEKTAVTQVSWNPNLVAGTWAAMGTGSGLVIVKDLAVD